MLQRVFELYSTLLDYPDESFVQDIHRLEQSVRVLGNYQPVLEQLELFKKSVGQLSLTEMQEMYTRTFDLTPVCSLYIGFHLFGESYKRGTLMAKLKQEYRLYGLQEGSEIPDHLSLMLKYLSVLSDIENEEKQEIYEEILTFCVCPGLEKMDAVFAETTNPYKYLLESLSKWLAEQRLPSKNKIYQIK